MVASNDGDLFLLGGHDGFITYRDIYAFNELYGFYDVGRKLPQPLNDFVAMAFYE